MNSVAGAGAIGADHDGSSLAEETDGLDTSHSRGGTLEKPEKIADILRQERERHIDEAPITSFSLKYGTARSNSDAEPGASEELDMASAQASLSAPASLDDSLSVPDDTPSIQGSARSSHRGSIAVSQASRSNLAPSPRPFERRFQARVSSSSSIPRAISPAFLTAHSRRASLVSQFTIRSAESERVVEEKEEQDHWQVVRWTKLKKISSHAFSEAGKRTFGRPAYLTVAASIAVGTSKGLVLLFDYQQTLKGIIGQGTPATESGSVTSLAISADHSTIAAGHANGYIFTWDIAHPAKPFLSIPPLSISTLRNRKGDGHIAGSAVLHVGFLGQRRTALVSADDSGMGFSHLATRGLGAVGRSVKTTRILGRYPDPSSSSGPLRKPSSVLAFSPLPLGNVERSTDELGLTALLTPFLLVIVSTTPVAQTQFKLPREKKVAAHSAMTGCLAWFPAVKLKISASDMDPSVSKTKLAYCWSNVLSVLEVDESATNFPSDAEKKPELTFTPRSQWRSEEAILAVQWLSRSVIAVLTVSQRLVILEDPSMRVTDSSDLNPKHVFHQDLFSRQLQPLVDKVGQGEDTMHGVIPDAYHMSFKAYKGRLFLLGMSDMSLGVISNWADRLVALMEAGKPIAAIELATSYYTGETDTVTIGLPDDDDRRQKLVKDKLLELMSASLRYIFKEDESDGLEHDLRSELQEFASAAFIACLSMNHIDYLFDEVYEWYSEASMQDVFLYTLEPYIIDDKIEVVPTIVLKDMMNWYASHNLGSRLEEMICSLETYTMDIDQVTTVCKQLHLYDALIYVWTHGLGDFVTPLIELMYTAMKTETDQHREFETEAQAESTSKLFPYMAYTLTGRRYPDGIDLEPKEASRAKASMYGFVFSHRTVKWPQSHGKVISTRSTTNNEPIYPYLHVLLHVDAEEFMSMLNEVFEDSFLSGMQDQVINGISEDELRDLSFGMTVNRQRIVNILLEVMKGSESELIDKIYLDIFVARNLAKFRQFILLPNTTLRGILQDLCNYPSEELAYECQLSAEYLLSVYHPPDIQEIVPSLIEAGFFRVLKSTYRGSKQYSKWLDACFDDPDDQEAVFDCIGDCLRPDSGLSQRQIREIKEVITQHGKTIGQINPARAARCIQIYAPDLLEDIMRSLDQFPNIQYPFMRSIFDSQASESDGLHKVAGFGDEYQERYIELMCLEEPTRVAGYVSLLESSNLRLDRILPTMENSGVIDAAVAILARNGLVRDAMTRLVKHLNALKTALAGLLDTATHGPDPSNTEEAIQDLLESIDKYAKLGIWLCQGQTRNDQPAALSNQQRKLRPDEVTESDLTTEETMWLELVDVVVTVSRAISANAVAPNIEAGSNSTDNASKAAETLRATVQQVFTALLAATTSISTTSSNPSAPTTAPARSPAKPAQDQRFLHILRAFLSRTSRTTPSLSDLRKVLSAIFSAYAFEESMLALANNFLDKDVFVHVEEADRKRRVGWRPRSQLCEGCRRRAWGPGAGLAVWEAWEEGDEKRGVRRRGKMGLGRSDALEAEASDGGRKGKGRVARTPYSASHAEVAEGGANVVAETKPERIVLFSCKHLYHESCLKQAMDDAGMKLEEGDVASAGGRASFKCPMCK